MDDKKMALSISDAAKKLGVFRSGLYELLRGGKIPFVKTGKRLMILMEAPTQPESESRHVSEQEDGGAMPVSDYEKRMLDLLRLLHDDTSRSAVLAAMETLLEAMLAGADTRTALAVANRILLDAGRVPIDYDELLEALKASNGSAAD